MDPFIRFHVMFQQELLDMTDEYAKNETSGNRAEFIRVAVKRYIEYLKKKE